MTDKTVEKLADGFFRRMRLPEDIMSDAGERANMRDYIASGTSFLNLRALTMKMTILPVTCCIITAFTSGRTALKNFRPHTAAGS